MFLSPECLIIDSYVQQCPDGVNLGIAIIVDIILMRESFLADVCDE